MTTIDPSFPTAEFVPQGRFAHLSTVRIGRPLTIIGSGEHVHVRIRSTSVSPLHALVLNVDGRVVLRDLASETHVYVNNQRIRETILNHGDEIRIGHIRFSFNSGERVDSSSDVAMLPPVFLSSETGTVTPLEGLVSVIGNASGADLVNANTPSAAYAAILSIKSNRLIRFLGVGPRPRVNGLEVEQRTLCSGDVIQIDGQRYRVDTLAGDRTEPDPSFEEAAADDVGLTAVATAHRPASEGRTSSLLVHSEASQVANTRVFENNSEVAGPSDQPKNLIDAAEAISEESDPGKVRKLPDADVATAGYLTSPSNDAAPEAGSAMPTDQGIPTDIPSSRQSPSPFPRSLAVGLGEQSKIISEIPPFLRHCGPLAIAVAAQQYPDLIGRNDPEHATSHTGRRIWWIAIVLILILCGGLITLLQFWKPE